MKRMRLSKHAEAQAAERGATRLEIEEAVRKGSRKSATRGREMCRYNFSFKSRMAGQTLRNQTSRADHQRRARRNHCHYRLYILLLKRTAMKISYDPEVDALYIRLLKGKHTNAVPFACLRKSR
jgi:hypothetical protein